MVRCGAGVEERRGRRDRLLIKERQYFRAPASRQDARFFESRSLAARLRDRGRIRGRFD
jgi:hypothetical protein